MPKGEEYKYLIALMAHSVGIVYRPNSDTAKARAIDVAKWLGKKKCQVFSPPDFPEIPPAKQIKNGKDLDRLDLVVVLGGDGTFLGAARMLAGRQVPIIGFNLGNLGFLTENKLDECFDLMEMALKGKLSMQKRASLVARVCKNDVCSQEHVAMNDIVLERGGNSRLIDITVFCDDQLVSNVRSDGLIVATPTGSTAYCLAAGGPIVHPEVPAITIAPICPHTLTNRPIILPDNKEIRLKLSESIGSAVMMVDGKRYDDLKFEQELKITKAKKPILMYSHPDKSYFGILRSKLRFGQRE